MNCLLLMKLNLRFLPTEYFRLIPLKLPKESVRNQSTLHFSSSKLCLQLFFQLLKLLHQTMLLAMSIRCTLSTQRKQITPNKISRLQMTPTKSDFKHSVGPSKDHYTSYASRQKNSASLLALDWKKNFNFPCNFLKRLAYHLHVDDSNKSFHSVREKEVHDEIFCQFRKTWSKNVWTNPLFRTRERISQYSIQREYQKWTKYS